MKVLIVGGTGMLGHKLIQVLSRGFDVYTIIRSDKSDLEKYGFIEPDKIFERIDVRDFNTFNETLEEIKPDCVINSVGVIKQVEDSADAELVLDINSIFPQRIARIAAGRGFKFINISTDCVFSGKKGNYIEEDTSDAEDLYGKSKFLGEVFGQNCLTLRTSIIGRELATEHSLLEWFLKNSGETVKGYKNAVFTGFPTIILGKIIAGIIKNNFELEGLYHVSSEPINKYDLLCLIKEKFSLATEILPFEDFYIDRSLDSTKFKKITGFKTASWDEMIQEMADDETPYEKWKKQTF